MTLYDYCNTLYAVRLRRVFGIYKSDLILCFVWLWLFCVYYCGVNNLDGSRQWQPVVNLYYKLVMSTGAIGGLLEFVSGVIIYDQLCIWLCWYQILVFNSRIGQVNNFANSLLRWGVFACNLFAFDYTVDTITSSVGCGDGWKSRHVFCMLIKLRDKVMLSDQ